jgi:hypothetical protein
VENGVARHGEIDNDLAKDICKQLGVAASELVFLLVRPD